ncbi:hypothetical protein [Pollutibacter soli]|uniref:hypothetical protein n=1 Tax=Pollutibacter soli TaxID=3034157 RepID=UPI003AF457E8
MSISALTKALKARSSKYINGRCLTKRKLEWQKGSALFLTDDQILGNFLTISQTRKNSIEKFHSGMNTYYC